MKIAIISDVHANLQSIKEVYEDIKKQNITKVYCLGDVIDYGAQPEEVIQYLKKQKTKCILGNHDAALFDKEVLKWFNDDAIESSIYSRKTISTDSKKYLKTLPHFIQTDEAYYVHAFPPDSFEQYITECTKEELTQAFDSFKQNVCFVGHTHILGVYIRSSSGKIKNKELKRSLKLKKDYRYIINVGSTGQPRDEDNRAKYIIFDINKQKVIVRRVDYNIKKAQKNIIKAGLPEENANILS